MSLTNNSYKGLERSFCIRMKSTLTKRGCHFKSSGYRVVLLLCHLRPQAYPTQMNRKQSPNQPNSQPMTLLGLVAVAIALPPPSINEVRLESDMFVTRLTFDFKIAHCEPRVSDLLDYTADEMTGKNMYALCHGEDMNKLRSCHVDLIQKGQVMSGYYRIINKSGGYTWIQTCATVVLTTKNSDEQSIICVNYVISGIEHEHCIMDCSQMAGGCQVDKSSSEDRGRKDYPQTDHSPDVVDNDHKYSIELCKEVEESRDSPHKISEKRTSNGKEAHQLLPLRGDNESNQQSQIQLLGKDIDVKSSGGSGKRGRKPKEKRSLLDMDRKRRRYHHRSSEEAAADDEDDEDLDEIPIRERMSLMNQQQHSLRSAGNKKSSSPKPNSPIMVSKSHCDEASDGEEVDSPPPPPHNNRSGSWNGGRVEYPNNSEELSNNTSVKDIEDAMNKHLPLLQAKELAEGKTQRPTIQWIGGTSTAAQQNSTTALAASALLRQLYVNRESVIRSNVHATRSPFFGTSVKLATPPGGDPSAYSDPFVLSSKIPLGHPGDGYTYPSPYTAAEAYGAMTPPSSVSPREKLHPVAVSGFDGGRWIDPSGTTAGPGATTITGPGGGGGMDSNPTTHLPLKPQVYTAIPTLETSPFPAHSQQGTLVHMSDHHPHSHHHHHHHSLPHHPHAGAGGGGGAAASAAGQQFYPHHASSFHVYHPMASKMTPPPLSSASSSSSSSASPPVTSASTSSSSTSSSANSYIESVKNGNVWYPPTNT